MTDTRVQDVPLSLASIDSQLFGPERPRKRPSEFLIRNKIQLEKQLYKEKRRSYKNHSCPERRAFRPDAEELKDDTVQSLLGWQRTPQDLLTRETFERRHRQTYREHDLYTYTVSADVAKLDIFVPFPIDVVGYAPVNYLAKNEFKTLQAEMRAKREVEAETRSRYEVNWYGIEVESFQGFTLMELQDRGFHKLQGCPNCGNVEEICMPDGKTSGDKVVGK